jgi:hypothetical protein
VLVEDNTRGNILYAASANLNQADNRVLLVARDATRTSGAFNILEMLQEAGEMLDLADRTLVAPDVTVLWSPLNSPINGVKEGIGSTYFDARTNTMSFLGDRSSDSDEFDDSVIVHEYGHLVAAAFSRDSSPGGVHILGDELDPRIAFSEGWANFFSSAVRDDPIYRDSYGPNGTAVLRYDLREKLPAGDKPGYWSEFSVHSILWDILEEKVGDTENIEQPIQTIWPAFRDLKQDHFVYLTYFLEHIIDNRPALASAVSTIARSRSVDFHPEARPSVPNPYPRPINAGETIAGTVDSVSTQRKDLLQSSDFLVFHAPAGPTSIRMDITGLGAGNNPKANDLDLFLYNWDGRLIDRSDRGLDGQSELIAIVLAEGTYVVEVRSYYDRDDTQKTVFNSGTYRLLVHTQ